MALHIDVFSDVICPWCYIGKRRLEKAIATLQLERECQRRFQIEPLWRFRAGQRRARLRTFFRHKSPQLPVKGICGEKMLWREWLVFRAQSGLIFERGSHGQQTRTSCRRSIR